MSATAPVRISYYAYPSLDINGAIDVTIGEVEFDPSITKDLPAFAAYGSTERLLHTAIRILLLLRPNRSRLCRQAPTAHYRRGGGILRPTDRLSAY